MYSGTTLTKLSGRVIGGHQKIDRVARKILAENMKDDTGFPQIRKVLLFEGTNGPDGLKRKSPSKDEPWHFFNPFDDDDVRLLNDIQHHFSSLVSYLKSENTERSAFEAAWLAHAVVDGLTPAHHYPYEEKLVELSDGAAHDTRVTLKKKIVMPGATASDQIRNNWRAWGPRGLRTAHGLFEIGVSSLIAPLSFGEVRIKPSDIKHIDEVGMNDWYRGVAREIAVDDMYHNYIDKGWTPKLAYQVRHKLGPSMIHAVALVWFLAAREAGLKVK